MLDMCAITPGKCLLGWGAFFCSSVPLEFKCSLCEAQKFHGEGNPMQNGLSPHIQSSIAPLTGSGS